MKWATLALTLPFAGHALAEGLILQSPIDCDLASDCYIQQYVDRDPSEGVTDYQCAGLSYNGHKGTDFALVSIADIEKGIAVFASADGVVEGTRDGMYDVEYNADTADAVKNRECGNGVQINHGQGWVTQYCHLRKGSVIVKKGQTVAAGDPIGQVGMSGRAAFPHVHLSVRKNDKVIDPFDPDGTLTCNDPNQETLWADAPAYRPGGLISIGFSDQIPTYESIKAGSAAMQNFTPDAKNLVVYGFAFGIRQNDVLHLSITGPEGEVIKQDVEMSKSQARSFRAIGKKRRWSLWPAGTYKGSVSLLRDGQVITQRVTEMTIR